MGNVLLVGKGAPERGGIPSFLNLLCTSELADKHDVRLLNLARPGPPQGGRLSVTNIASTVRDALSVRRAARARDIVHIHSSLGSTVTVIRAGLLAVAARSRGCAVIVHAHGGAIQAWLTTARRRSLVRLAMRPAHRVIAVWTAGETALSAALGAGRTVLIDNGVDVTAFGPGTAANHPPRILYVGLLTPRKGVLDLLEASQLLTDRGIDHELHLLGGTPDEGRDAELQVRERVGGARLLGTRSPEQMPDAYADADVFCLPSWWEAMPLSVLEAMAAGLPVVACDVGDVARAVLHGQTGLVVQPRSPDELAAALQQLLVDPERRRRMGRLGRAHVEDNFSSRRTVAEISTLYAEVELSRR